MTAAQLRALIWYLDSPRELADEMELADAFGFDWWDIQ